MKLSNSCFAYLLALLLMLESNVVRVSSLSSIAVAVPASNQRTTGSGSSSTFSGSVIPVPAPTTVSKDLAKTQTKAAQQQVTTYEEAIQVIDQCVLEQNTDDGELYNAVRLIEQQAYKFYPELSDKEALWDRAQGCWQLVFSTGNGKNRQFDKPKYLFPFSFAMISGKYFGNGFGLSPNNIWVSVLQQHVFHPKRRQMVVTVLDVYLGGNKATAQIPTFLKDAINLGRTPEDFVDVMGKPAPAFCIVAATEHALIARGNQSGALAIWKKLPKDIQPVAYKDLPL